MLRKIGLFFIIGSFFITACSTSKYSDFKSFMKKMIKVQEDYISAIEKAEKADDVAKAIDTYGDYMVEYAKDAEKFNKKYPELKDAKMYSPPAELADEYQKLNEVTTRIAKISMGQKMRKFLMDKKVRKSLMNLSKKLSKLDMPGMKP